MMRAGGMGRKQPHGFGRVGIDHGLTTTGNARIVDQNIEASEIGDHGLDHCLVLRIIIDGCRIDFRTSAQRADFGGDLGRCIRLAPIIDRDVGAVLGQAQGNGTAHAAACARYQRNASVQ